MTEVTVYADGRCETSWVSVEYLDEHGDLIDEQWERRVVGTITLPAWAWSDGDE